MPDVPVTLLVWHDAEKERPTYSDVFPTDVGRLMFQPGLGWERNDPQPSVWCDPTPPGDDALTVADLRELANFPFLRFATPRAQLLIDAAARLRRALDQIGTT